MRRSSGTIAVLMFVSTVALVGCGQQASTPAASGTPIGAAAVDAEAQAAADARAVELAAKEKELADREAALAQQELAAAEQAAAENKAKADAAKAAAVATAAAANKPASKPAAPKPAPAPKPIVVPAGTPVAVELASTVTTKGAQVGDAVQARLASDLVVDGRRAAKAGATVYGTVSQVVSGSNKIGGVPTLGLTFSSLVAADGSTQTINASHVVQGKSETGKDTAKILGAAAAGAVVGHQVDHDKGAVIGGLLGVGAGAAAAKKTGGDIELPAGQVLQLATTSSFEVKP